MHKKTSENQRHYLHGSDGALLGGSNTLLHAAHVRGQGGLITDGGGDTSEQGGHFGTGLRETEDVVDEEQHVLTLVVAEVFSDRQSRQADTGAGAWGLVHLSVHERDLRIDGRRERKRSYKQKI